MIADKRVERAAKVIRRMEYSAKIDPRPWRKISAAARKNYLAKARKILNAAWRD